MSRCALPTKDGAVTIYVILCNQARGLPRLDGEEVNGCGWA